METKTVQGTFGPKQITKDEFVKQWTNSIAEIGYICETGDDYRTLQAMQEQVRKLAERKWEMIK